MMCFAVGEDKELERCWLLLAGLVADEDDHLADALDWRLQNCLNCQTRLSS